MIQEAYDERATESLQCVGLVNANSKVRKTSSAKTSHIGDTCTIESMENGCAVPTLAAAEQVGPHDAP
eukprot:10385887-Karenia_brevis.AAC.4